MLSGPILIAIDEAAKELIIEKLSLSGTFAKSPDTAGFVISPP